MKRNETMTETTGVQTRQREKTHLLLHDISRKRHVLILCKEYAKEYPEGSDGFKFDFASLIHDLEAFYEDGTLPAEENILPKLPQDYLSNVYVVPEPLEEAILSNFETLFLKIPENRVCEHYGECGSHYNDLCKDCCACIFPPE